MGLYAGARVFRACVQTQSYIFYTQVAQRCYHAAAQTEIRIVASNASHIQQAFPSSEALCASSRSPFLVLSFAWPSVHPLSAL